MNKKIISMIVLVCAVTLTGCGFSESSGMMTDARSFIEHGEYDKAMDNLSTVLEEDENNSEARGMYYQAMKLKKATKYKDRKDYEQEIKELQDLINDGNGSAKIRNKAEDMLSEAKEALQTQKRATITRKENAKKAAEESKNMYASSSIYASSQYKKYLPPAPKKEEPKTNKYTNNQQQTSQTGGQSQNKYQGNYQNKYQQGQSSNSSNYQQNQGQGANAGTNTGTVNNQQGQGTNTGNAQTNTGQTQGQGQGQ